MQRYIVFFNSYFSVTLFWYFKENLYFCHIKMYYYDRTSRIEIIR